MHLQDYKRICKIINAFARPRMQDCEFVFGIAYARSRKHLQDFRCICKIPYAFARSKIHLQDQKCICKIAKAFARLQMHMQDQKCICYFWVCIFFSLMIPTMSLFENLYFWLIISVVRVNYIILPHGKKIGLT